MRSDAAGFRLLCPGEDYSERIEIATSEAGRVGNGLRLDLGTWRLNYDTAQCPNVRVLGKPAWIRVSENGQEEPETDPD